MNEDGHLTTAERAAYWQQSLAPGELLELSDHLQECALCREELLQTRPKTESDEGVSYEECLAWMDGTLDPLARRALANRIAESPRASAALVDLLRFRDEMNELPAHDYSLADADASSRGLWILPLAAGLVLGLSFLWLTTVQHNRRGVVLHDGGQQLFVRQDGAVPALGMLPPELQNAARAAAGGKLNLPPSLNGLRGEGETLAGTATPTSVATLAPVGTFVETARPTLRWNSQEGATGYRVNLAPQSGGEVISSPVLAAGAREWTPSESLRPNEIYNWEVEALRDDAMIGKAPAPPEPEARFAVLSDDRRAELAKLRAQFGRSHFVMGLAYAKAGLLAPARAEFEALARENPKNDLANKLLSSLTNRPNAR